MVQLLALYTNHESQKAQH